MDYVKKKTNLLLDKSTQGITGLSRRTFINNTLEKNYTHIHICITQFD